MFTDMRTAWLLLLMLWACASPSFAQLPSLRQGLAATGLQKKSADGIKEVNGKVLSSLEKKYAKLNDVVEKQSQKMLVRMQRKEEKLKKQLAGTDSLQAAALFGGTGEQYAALKEKLHKPYDPLNPFPLKEYIPGIDSMQTALSFLKTKGAGLPGDKLEAISKAGSELKGLQDRLQKAGEVESFVRQREQELKARLQNSSGLARELKGINKETFYYSRRLREYKEMLKSPEKMEEKLLAAVRDSKAFQSFMQKHSYLSKLFPAPENYGTPAALAGLQTRAGVQGMLQQRFGMVSRQW